LYDLIIIQMIRKSPTEPFNHILLSLPYPYLYTYNNNNEPGKTEEQSTQRKKRTSLTTNYYKMFICCECYMKDYLISLFIFPSDSKYIEPMKLRRSFFLSVTKRGRASGRLKWRQVGNEHEIERKQG